MKLAYNFDAYSASMPCYLLLKRWNTNYCQIKSKCLYTRTTVRPQL